jgi:ribosomal protein L37E
MKKSLLTPKEFGMSRGNLHDRLEKLEASAWRAASGRCRECGLPPDGPGRIVAYEDGTPAVGFPDDPAERCERCGRYLWCVIHIIYDEEGEEARADA